jgi:hypothetical protein
MYYKENPLKFQKKEEVVQEVTTHDDNEWGISVEDSAD